MSDDFELGGEDEMEPTSSVTFSTSLHHDRVSQNRRAFVFIKHIHFFYLFFYDRSFR